MKYIFLSIGLLLFASSSDNAQSCWVDSQCPEGQICDIAGSGGLGECMEP